MFNEWNIFRYGQCVKEKKGLVKVQKMCKEKQS